MRLFLVRHGQTAWNVAGRAQGHTDIPLDEVGHDQKEMLAGAFRGTRLARVFTSDLARARQTAECLAQAIPAPLEIREDLRERGFGQWEGRPWRELADWTLEESIRLGTPRVSIRPPGGESYKDLWDRTAGFVGTLVEAGEDAAVVSHGGTLAVIMAHLVQGTPETARSFRFGNTAVYEVVRREDGYFSIARYNDTSHLDGALPKAPASGQPIGAAPLR